MTNPVQNFLSRFTQWGTVEPQPAPPPSREELRRQLREQYREKLGTESLADVALEIETRKADERVRLERQLRERLTRVEQAIEAFNRETVQILAPLESRISKAQSALTAACEALQNTQIARSGELATTLGKERDEIRAQLFQPFDIAGRVIGWREGGSAPQFPPGT